MQYDILEVWFCLCNCHVKHKHVSYHSNVLFYKFVRYTILFWYSVSNIQFPFFPKYSIVDFGPWGKFIFGFNDKLS